MTCSSKRFQQISSDPQFQCDIYSITGRRMYNRQAKQCIEVVHCQSSPAFHFLYFHELSLPFFYLSLTFLLPLFYLYFTLVYLSSFLTLIALSSVSLSHTFQVSNIKWWEHQHWSGLRSNSLMI